VTNGLGMARFRQPPGAILASNPQPIQRKDSGDGLYLRKVPAPMTRYAKLARGVRRKLPAVFITLGLMGMGLATPAQGQAAGAQPAAPGQLTAQAAAPAPAANGIAGTWQGTLHAGRDLRIVMKVTTDGGAVKATMYSLDQGGQPIPATSASLRGGRIQVCDSDHRWNVRGETIRGWQVDRRNVDAGG